MLRVLACLRYEHDYRLVILAVGICAVTSATAFYVHRMSFQATGIKKICGIFLTGVAAGSGIWATHFVAMLAFRAEPFTLSYDPFLTFASLLIAILFTAAGFGIAGRPGPLWQLASGGVLIGIGIDAMHYTGMAALNFPGEIVWDPKLVLASLVLAMAFAAAATASFNATRPWTILGAASLLTVAICSLHFTAMGAALLSPDPTVLVSGMQFKTAPMAAAVSVVTMMVILTGATAALIDRESGKEVSRVHEAYAVREARQRREAERLHHLAHHDCLTGLPNRTALTERLGLLVSAAREVNFEFAVLFIDLDGFKRMNDTYGHAFGDRVLREVARRLSALTDVNEFVGRTGGDEFVILQTQSAQPASAKELAERLLTGFARGLEEDGMASIKLSIGIAIYPSDGDTAESLLNRADGALYWAKGDGGGRVCLCAEQTKAA